MRFPLILPRLCAAEIVQAGDPNEAARRRAGITRADHAIIMRRGGEGIGIVVDEFGMYVLVAKQFYFAIGKQLYAGNAVLYAFNRIGETVDFMGPIPTIAFFRSQAEIEDAIAHDQIVRPKLRVNGEVVWSWPDDAPPELREATA